MSLVDFSVLDRADVSGSSFYPRSNWTPTPPGAEDNTISVAEGVSLSCRFFTAGKENPTILFFYGNGETAADYDGIAPLYNQIGVNLFVADYRGYGRSGGSPAFCDMSADAATVLRALRKILDAGHYTGSIFVMGRSMGRHAAFELAANANDSLQGLIVESGRPSLGQFVHRLEPSVAQKLEAAYQEKVRSISMPVLVIHGELDTLAPLHDAVSMHESFPSQHKRLIIIPGAGHNDLMYLGRNQYFAAVQEFVSVPTSS